MKVFKTIGYLLLPALIVSCGGHKSNETSTATKEMSPPEKAALDSAPKALIVKAVESEKAAGGIELKMVGVSEPLTSSDPQYLETMYAKGKEIPYGLASANSSTAGSLSLSDGYNQYSPYSPGFQPNLGYVSPGVNNAGSGIGGGGGLLGLGILPTFRQFLQNSLGGGSGGGLFSNLLGIFRGTPAYYNAGNFNNTYQPLGGGLLSGIGNGGILNRVRSMFFGYQGNGQILQQPFNYPQGGSTGSVFDPSLYGPAYTN